MVSEVSREWRDEAVEWVEWMLVFAVLESEDRSERGTGRGRGNRQSRLGIAEKTKAKQTDARQREKPTLIGPHKRKAERGNRRT